MSLADYIAKNYLTADSKPDKKSKKRKRKDASAGLVIADDDNTGWENTKKSSRRDDEGPITGISSIEHPALLVKLTLVPVSGTSSEFRKSKSSNWQTLSGASIPQPTNTDAQAADHILRAAAAEAQALDDADNAAPTILSTSDAPSKKPITKLTSGAHAGLQTAAQLTAQLAAREREEAAALAADPSLNPANAAAQETIYRDASGRMINIAKAKATAQQKAEEEALAIARKKAREEEEAKGDVQRREKEERRKELDHIRGVGVARYADDKDLNEELRARDRWNDPAREFLTNRGSGGGGGAKAGGSKGYQGASMPNRYGIRPGSRWDGVDRGNGFEAKWFQARNRVTKLKELEYAWQGDE